MNKKNLFILVGMMILVPTVVFAGAFQVVPPKVIFDFKKGAKASVTMTNQGYEKVTIEVNVAEWTQDANGSEVYKPTKDVAFYPKIFSIDPNKEGTVRLGYIGKQSDTEKTYRLFLRELPTVIPGELSVKTAIQITIPVFFPPAKETQENRMVIEKSELLKGKVIVNVKNNANAHIMASKIKAVGLDETGNETFSKEITGWYVLPGISKPFAVDVVSEDCLRSKTIKVMVEEEKSRAESGLDVDLAMCAKEERKKDIKNAGIDTREKGL